MRRIRTQEIIYIESLDNYVKIFLPDEIVVTKEKISRLDEKLPQSFLRIHRSFIINKDKIDSFTKENIKQNSQELPISRSYKKVVLEVLNTKEPGLSSRLGFCILGMDFN